MAVTIPDLETEALRLDPRDRIHLAHTLVTSLGELSPQQIQELWLDEAERRDEELEAGTVQAVPGPEVFARIRRRHS
jgi:putative addiction module component (TIGR02574 family)